MSGLGTAISQPGIPEAGGLMWASVVQVFTWAVAGEASGSLSVVNKFIFF